MQLRTSMATLRAHRHNVHLYVLAILILMALMVVLATLPSHKPPPRGRYVEAKSLVTGVPV
jgi:hypothetical protein